MHSTSTILWKTSGFFAIALVARLLFSLNPLTIDHRQWIDIDNDIEETVTRHGYHFENYSLITKDGYILQVHRINRKKLQSTNSSKVVFFMHGGFQSSMGWLIAGVEHSLPFRLADGGYDVWLGNCRGNRYSRNHLSLDPDRQPAEFFNFSFHEMGMYDLPKNLEHIIKITGVEKIHLVTHSQGSATVFVLLSEKPEYNLKIRSHVALAPGVYLRHRFQLLTLMSLQAKIYEWFVLTFKIYELFPYSDFGAILAKYVCADGSPLQSICTLVLGCSCGFNYAELNTTLLARVFTYEPCGASWKQVMHYAQIRATGVFQKYDEGKTQNLIQYGQEHPVEYKLRNVKIPQAMFYSDNDWAIHEQDFLQLYKELPNVDYLHKEDGYSHMDWYIAKSNIRILDAVEKYLSKH